MTPTNWRQRFIYWLSRTWWYEFFDKARSYDMQTKWLRDYVDELKVKVADTEQRMKFQEGTLTECIRDKEQLTKTVEEQQRELRTLRCQLDTIRKAAHSILTETVFEL